MQQSVADNRSVEIGRKRKAAKFLICPECRKQFASMRALNDHIEKTGDNGGKKLTIVLSSSSRPQLLFIARNYSQ